jgi:hypothetical protein
VAPAFYLEAAPLPGSPIRATSFERAVVAGIDDAEIPALSVQHRLAAGAVALQSYMVRNCRAAVPAAVLNQMASHRDAQQIIA